MKDITDINNESYNKGKKEGLEEILNWVKSNNNGDLKYIPATSFISMLNDKSKKSKTKLNKVLNEDSSIEDKDKDFNEDKKSKRGKKRNNNNNTNNYKFSFKLNEPSEGNLLEESTINNDNLTNLNKGKNSFDSTTNILSNCSINNLSLESKK